MSDPRKPVGRSNEAQFARWAHEKLSDQSRLGRVSGHRVINTTRGPLMIPSGTGNGGATVEMYVLAEPTDERRIVVEDDYLVCRDLSVTVDNDVAIGEAGRFVYTVGNSDTYIAKQHAHRCSIAKSRLLGVLWTYTYDRPVWDAGNPDVHQNVFRNAENPDEYVEEQRIVPPWAPLRTESEAEAGEEEPQVVYENIIYAVETTGTGVFRTEGEGEDATSEELTLLDVGSSRMWAKISVFAVP